MLNKKQRKSLHNVLTADVEDFTVLGDTVHTEHGPMIHIDRGGDTLAVGHLDWVHFNKKPKLKRRWNNLLIDKTPQLDDRLGVWVLLEMLPEINCNADILLCDSEEIGNSTAQYFSEHNNKKYNWMFEFDRAGSDAVMYKYEEQEYRGLLQDYGYEVGHGSFTDICELESLGCKAFNLGVGYHKQHTHDCYAYIAETFNSISKFKEMWKNWHAEHLDHKEVVWQPIKYNWNKNYKRPTKYYNSYQYYRDDHYIPPQKSVTYTSTEDDFKLVDEPTPAEKTQREKEWELDTIAHDLFGTSYDWCTDSQRKDVDKEYDKQNEEWGGNNGSNK